MALPEYTLKDLLESGVHFGHQTHRWNPLMQEYIYGVRNGIHIIDLTQTFQLLDVALNFIHDTVSKGGSILFVGTKRQAQKPISEAAERSAQYYMNHRWLGGTLTNWKTVSNSISRLKKLDEQLSDGATGLTKKERLNLEREQLKLNASLGGIREMGGTPDLIFVIDTNKESLAIQEAKKLGIPVIAVIDTNSDPSAVDFPIPGNDDAARSISLYCDLVAKAALEGMTNQLTSVGVDIGASIDPPTEELVQKDNSDVTDKNENNKKLYTDTINNDTEDLNPNEENKIDDKKNNSSLLTEHIDKKKSDQDSIIEDMNVLKNDPSSAKVETTETLNKEVKKDTNKPKKTTKASKPKTKVKTEEKEKKKTKAIKE